MAPHCKVPLLSPLSGELLDDIYTETFEKTVEHVKLKGGGEIGIDGGRFVLTKSVSNFIPHSPYTFFVEYLKTDLKWKTTINFSSEIQDTVSRINKMCDPIAGTALPQIALMA